MIQINNHLTHALKIYACINNTNKQSLDICTKNIYMHALMIQINNHLTYALKIYACINDTNKKTCINYFYLLFIDNMVIH